MHMRRHIRVRRCIGIHAHGYTWALACDSAIAHARACARVRARGHVQDCARGYGASERLHPCAWVCRRASVMLVPVRTRASGYAG